MLQLPCILFHGVFFHTLWILWNISQVSCLSFKQSILQWLSHSFFPLKIYPVKARAYLVSTRMSILYLCQCFSNAGAYQNVLNAAKLEWSTLERKFRDSVSVFITTSDQLNASRSHSNFGITSDSCLPTAQDIDSFFFTEIKLPLRQRVGHIFW